MTTNKNSGFIQMVLLIIVVVLILSYFGINLKNIAQSDTGKQNFGFLWDILLKIWDFFKFVWHEYLATPALWIWHNFFVDIVWNDLVDILNKTKTN